MESKSSKDVLNLVFDHNPKGQNKKQIAEKMSVSYQTLCRWSSTLDNPLRRIEQIIQITGGEEIAEWLRERADGGERDSGVRPGRWADKLAEESAEMITDYAEMINLLASTAKDGIITSKETGKIADAWKRIRSRTEAYLRDCKRGEYRGDENRGIECP
ncbi:MAG: hypothetical protein JWR26_4275 [Pedosphaera sp.]|nr:hypothetical protein [Pedosphaera sp.]